MTTAVLLPGGLLAPDPALETYQVAPGGAIEVELAGEDRSPDRRSPRWPGGSACRGVLEAIGLEGRPPLEAGSRCSAANRARARRWSSSPTGTRGCWSPPPGAGSSTVTRPASELMARDPALDTSRPGADRAATAARRATARLPDRRRDREGSYEVRAGEYIQILDVQGKQCSDFLAFHAR